jgi:hypothetical protein
MNPYSPPGSPPLPYAQYSPAPVTDGGGAAGVSDAAVEMLRQTRPWAMLFSVLSFLGSGFMLLASLGMMVFGATSGAGLRSVAFGLFYVPFAGLYVYPGVKLWAYGSSIARLVATRSQADLESALGQQKSFWKYSGIAAVVMIVVYFFGMVAFFAIWQYLAPTSR